jgi:hypothetical protein
VEGDSVAVALGPWKAKREPGWQRRIDEMSDELRRQAAHIAAAEYRWLRLLGEFDAAEGWVQGGARSCVHWLSWACGLSGAAARERVRVARALPALPHVCEAFAAGRLSYSKVRAITRVATPENEELLTSYGQSATAAQLETVLRGYRRVKRLDEAKEAAEQHDRRYLRHWVDDEGCVRIEARYPAEDGAFVIAELERLAQSGGDDKAAPPAEPGSASAEAAEASRGDTPIVLSRWDASDPVDMRRADALRMMAETAAAHGPKAVVGGEEHLVVLHVRSDELRSDPQTQLPVADPATDASTSIEGAGRVSAETARRVACDADLAVLVEDALGRPLGVGRQSAKIPRRLRRALKRRDRGRCQFPNCLLTAFLDGHHIKHWADGGPTELANLVLLCRFHHRLVHEVGYTVRLSDGAGPAIFTRPDGTVIPASLPAGPAEVAAVERANESRQLVIDCNTSVPDWDGSRPDYSLAVGLLLDASAEAPPPIAS